MDISSIALQGVAHAEAQANAAAAGLANYGTEAAQTGAPVDTVDLSAQIVQLQSAENLVAINLSTLKTADQIQQNLINLMA